MTLRTGIDSELQPPHKLNGLSSETEEYLVNGCDGFVLITVHYKLTDPLSDDCLRFRARSAPADRPAALGAADK